MTNLEKETYIVHLLKDVTVLTQDVSAIKIDIQNVIQRNSPIPPGIGCKFAYDKNGLILKATSLESSDIPKLPISKIDGLEQALSHIVVDSDLERLKVDIQNSRLKKGNPIDTGVKVSIDSNGLVVSVSELNITDIPILPMSHIRGLSNELELIKASIEDNAKAISEEKIVNAGTYPKITFDNTGRVISGTQLSITDIPNEIITKLNELEAKMPMFASNSLVTNLSKKLNDKLDSNRDITPGEYTKVIVDKNGLVIRGNNLSKLDLPELTIKDITDLDIQLRNRATIDQFTELNNTVSQLVSYIDKINDVVKLKNEVNKKAKEEDMLLISSKVDSLQSLVDKLNQPNELIVTMLDSVNKQLSDINARISILENKFSTIIKN